MTGRAPRRKAVIGGSGGAGAGVDSAGLVCVALLGLGQPPPL